jgi:transglutaminase-like putative cysteine protease
MHNLESAMCQVRYKVVHATTYLYSEPVPLCHNEIHLKPRNTPRQSCLSHELSIRPVPLDIETCLDYFGNQVQFFTIQEQHHELLVRAESEVRLLGADNIPLEDTPPWEQVRDRMRGARDPESLDARQFVLDSPNVPTSTGLAEFAAVSFTPGRAWCDAVLDLTARIYDGFIYDPMATNVSTPIAEVLDQRRGVCQDFAHLQIGCLRSIGLPARYVSGYVLTSPPPGQPRLVGADASHAWLSAYCPDIGWIEFDPTNNLIPSLEHITVAWGRDYSDVCPIKGVFVGGGQHSMRVSVDVRPLEPCGPR